MRRTGFVTDTLGASEVLWAFGVQMTEPAPADHSHDMERVPTHSLNVWLDLIETHQLEHAYSEDLAQVAFEIREALGLPRDGDNE